MVRFIVLSLVLGFAVTTTAQDWGDVSGTFIFDGAPPEPKPLDITRDNNVCGKQNDESILVAKNGGLKNVVVWLYTNDVPPIHPAYAAAPKELLLDNNKCRFEPRVAGLWTKQTLVLGNSDPVGHNSKLDFFNNDPRNDNVPSGAKLKLVGKINVGERLPTPVMCGSHPWMKGHLLVQEHPYFAVTDANGKFTIKNVPAGEWTFKVWHERTAYVQRVNVDGADTTWKFGAVKVTVGAGENSLGTVKLSPEIFDK